jgi:hypothetical protein
MFWVLYFTQKQASLNERRDKELFYLVGKKYALPLMLSG